MLPERDDDRTVIRGAPISASSSAASTEATRVEWLQLGAKLGEFVLERVIGTGGFSIVYLARDEQLGRRVALKEYFPESIAYRASDVTVHPKSQRDNELFSTGLSSFINEARLLAHFDSPSLVKVYRFWQENGTAYMVMPFYEGPTLKQALAEMSQRPDEAWMQAIFEPVMDALELLHAENCFHRDIAPDNILLVRGEQPVLLDFGAARRVIEDRAKTLTVILKAGYAPVEQYGDSPELKQGAWTDIYALAAVMYEAITGRAPIPSVTRALRDTVEPLSVTFSGKYSAPLLNAIDKALSVHPEARPQTIAEFRRLLQGDRSRAATASSAPRPANPRNNPARNKLWVWAAVPLVLVAMGAASWMILRPSGPGAQSARGKSNGTMAQTPGPAAGASSVVNATQPPASPLSPSPAAVEASVSAGQTAGAAAQDAAKSPAAPVTAAAPEGTTSTQTPVALAALRQLIDLSDSDRNVEVLVKSSRVRIGKDKLQFTVRSSEPGYLYVFMRDTDRGEVNLLFPNSFDSRNKIDAGQSLTLPRSSWVMTAAGPRGTDEFVAVVSAKPLNFKATKRGGNRSFQEFPGSELEGGLGSAARTPALLASAAGCSDNAVCNLRYGAAAFRIEER